jgi:hypothetical protein
MIVPPLGSSSASFSVGMTTGTYAWQHREQGRAVIATPVTRVKQASKQVRRPASDSEFAFHSLMGSAPITAHAQAKHDVSSPSFYE